VSWVSSSPESRQISTFKSIDRGTSRSSDKEFSCRQQELNSHLIWGMNNFLPIESIFIEKLLIEYGYYSYTLNIERAYKANLQHIHKLFSAYFHKFSIKYESNFILFSSIKITYIHKLLFFFLLNLNKFI
jgi:hypothetical protein